MLPSGVCYVLIYDLAAFVRLLAPALPFNISL